MAAMPATKVDRASVKEIKAYFETVDTSDEALARLEPKKVKLTDMTELKASNGGKDFDHIANGIGGGTLTY